MYLTQLKLTQYRSHGSIEILPAPALNAITGPNGVGKTNLLDAIYQLSVCKSHLSALDSEILQLGEPFYRLEGQYADSKKTEQVVIKYQPGRKKVVEFNGEPRPTLSAHLGTVPVLLIAPDDVALAREGGEERRRFMDQALCQVDRQYLQHLMHYNKVLEQRNALLKSESTDLEKRTLLDIYDAQMQPAVSYIVAARLDFIGQLNPAFEKGYAALSGERERATCIYQTKLLENSWLNIVKSYREKDIAAQRSNVGVHKDDLAFALNQMPIKRLGSQGQLKCFVIALKLAQFEQLQLNKTPILLLDDVFDKLDPDRVAYLLRYLTTEKFGQVFLTDTDPTRIALLAERLQLPFKHFKIDINGVLEV